MLENGRLPILEWAVLGPAGGRPSTPRALAELLPLVEERGSSSGILGALSAALATARLTTIETTDQRRLLEGA